MKINSAVHGFLAFYSLAYMIAICYMYIASERDLSIISKKELAGISAIFVISAIFFRTFNIRFGYKRISKFFQNRLCSVSLITLFSLWLLVQIWVDEMPVLNISNGRPIPYDAILGLTWISILAIPLFTIVLHDGRPAKIVNGESS